MASLFDLGGGEEQTEFTDSQIVALEAKVKKEAQTIVYKRAAVKRKITSVLNKLDASKHEEGLTEEVFLAQKAVIDVHLVDIKRFDEELISSCCENKLFQAKPTLFETEIDSQSDYHFAVVERLSSLQSIFSKKDQSVIGENLNSTLLNESIHAMISEMKQTEVRPPPLQCASFENNLKDKFAFKNFLTQFQNLIQSKKNLSEASKLTYLRGYMKGYALKVIEHLSVTDENFRGCPYFT